MVVLSIGGLESSGILLYFGRRLVLLIRAEILLVCRIGSRDRHSDVLFGSLIG